MGSSSLSLLILEEQRTIREACREFAAVRGFQTFTAENDAVASRLLQNHAIDIVLLDLPDGASLERIHEARSVRPEAEILTMSSGASVRLAVAAMKAGASDFLAKPFDVEELASALQDARDRMLKVVEGRRLRNKLRPSAEYFGLVGRSPEMEKICRIIAKVANSTHPVLITGESGTGKEMTARAIHYAGANASKPFVAVDCGSLVPTLIESELFGYVKGAFTGANRSKDGLLAVAEGGTVFLDEIGELPVDLQSKLLRALQEKEIRPVGSTRTVPINVRVLAATNRRLEEEIAAGRFRKDLYFRLNVVNLRMPSLRERREDISLLIRHFLDRMARTAGVTRAVSDEALKLMMTYDWPGNVRELENCLERACALSSGPMIHVGDLPSPIQNHQVVVAGISANSEFGDRLVSMAELEKNAIMTAIARLNGDKLRAARVLGIGKTTLYRKLKEYQLD